MRHCSLQSLWVEGAITLLPSSKLAEDQFEVCFPFSMLSASSWPCQLRCCEENSPLSLVRGECVLQRLAWNKIGPSAKLGFRASSCPKINTFTFTHVMGVIPLLFSSFPPLPCSLYTPPVHHCTLYPASQASPEFLQGSADLTLVQCFHGALQERSRSCKPPHPTRTHLFAPAALQTYVTVHIELCLIPRERDLRLFSVKSSKQWLQQRAGLMACARVLISTRLRQSLDFAEAGSNFKPVLLFCFLNDDIAVNLWHKKRFFWHLRLLICFGASESLWVLSRERFQ